MIIKCQMCPSAYFVPDGATLPMACQYCDFANGHGDRWYEEMREETLCHVDAQPDENGSNENPRLSQTSQQTELLLSFSELAEEIRHGNQLNRELMQQNSQLLVICQTILESLSDEQVEEDDFGSSYLDGSPRN